MNTLDKLFFHLPFQEVKIETTLPGHAVIERLEYALRPTFIVLRSAQYYTFKGECEGEQFMLEAILRNRDGSEVFESELSIEVLFFRFAQRTDMHPVFYGRVLDDENGSTITGCFGSSASLFALCWVPLLWLLGEIYDFSTSGLVFVSLFLLVSAVFCYFLEDVERKGVVEFLNGLFYNSMRKA